MIDLDQVPHHPAIDEIVSVICDKTQNTNRGFFDVEVAYFLAKMAACMRVTVVTKDRGEVPINIYAIALASSGAGKGFSVNIMEEDFISGFKSRFMSETLPVISDQHLYALAQDRAIRDGTEEEDEKTKIDREFNSSGAYAFTFDSGTTPALKQLRHKLLMAQAGSINFQVDEIGSNLEGSTELLNAFLELYDKGRINQKLTKNTNENQRGEELDGSTPANALLFGTPVKLLDGGATENAFYSFLETGYARRCLFGMGHKAGEITLTPEEVFSRLINPANNATIQKWHTHFTELADPARMNWRVILTDEVAIELIRYKMECEEFANSLPDHEEILKSEISHRYFKTLKLAGTFAFVDESMELEMEHLHSAMKLVEESGESFKGILRREKTYVKLAKYLADVDTPQTHADLMEALPYYQRSTAARNEMMSLATAWGYKNHTIIQKSFADGIEFFDGSSLEETDLQQVTVAYSNHMAYHYRNEKIPFSDFGKLATQPGYHWTNHHVAKGHRAEENVQSGFNLLVLDVDDGNTSLETACDLLSEYTYFIHTTKRHTDEEPRFRIVLPINYRLTLDTEEYKTFMENIVEWLPFKVDESANQRSRKWLCCDGAQTFSNDAEILDILKFVPRTSRNEQYQEENKNIGSMDQLERWFAERIATGNRNNHLIRFALTLVDSGMPYAEVEQRVLGFNGKLGNGLTEDELRKTVLVTAAKRSNDMNS